MSTFEAERLKRIADNKRRMAELGLAQASSNLQASTRLQRKPAVKRRTSAPACRIPESERRRSSRSEGKPPPCYNENALDTAERAVSRGKRQRTYDNLLVGAAEEKYTQRHVELLGDCQTPWELFVDGYDVNGVRMYDKVEGQTCHQCRQKTLGRRTSCSQCHSLTGVFCGDCLFMRYGENVEEANADPDWTCPHCRDELLCNCSQHRTRRGWAPTGTLYRKAIALGFKSVAHYLVLNHLEGAEPAVAADADKAAAAASPSAPGTPPRDGEATPQPASSSDVSTGAAPAEEASPVSKTRAGYSNGAKPTANGRSTGAQPTVESDGFSLKSNAKKRQRRIDDVLTQRKATSAAAAKSAMKAGHRASKKAPRAGSPAPAAETATTTTTDARVTRGRQATVAAGAAVIVNAAATVAEVAGETRASPGLAGRGKRVGAGAPSPDTPALRRSCRAATAAA